MDVRSTIQNALAQDPTTILSDVSSKTPISDATNTPVEPTGEFKTIVSDRTEALFFLISPIYYEPQNVLLILEDLKQ